MLKPRNTGARAAPGKVVPERGCGRGGNQWIIADVSPARGNDERFFLDGQLFQPCRNTDYRVMGDSPFTIRIGLRCLARAALLSARGRQRSSSWCKSCNDHLGSSVRRPGCHACKRVGLCGVGLAERLDHHLAVLALPVVVPRKEDRTGQPDDTVFIGGYPDRSAAIAAARAVSPAFTPQAVTGACKSRPRPAILIQMPPLASINRFLCRVPDQAFQGEKTALRRLRSMPAEANRRVNRPWRSISRLGPCVTA